MRIEGIAGAIASTLRSLVKRTGTLARRSLEEESEDQLAPPTPPQPGPPHGPIPAIDLRRDPHRGEVPPSAGPPP